MGHHIKLWRICAKRLDSLCKLSCIEWVWDLHNNSLDHLGLVIKKREFAFQMRLPFSKPRIPWLKVVRFKDTFIVNSPGTNRVRACVRNATARHACIVWLDRTAIFKVKSSCLSRCHCFLLSQTILACFAIASWTHSSTRFVTGELLFI